MSSGKNNSQQDSSKSERRGDNKASIADSPEVEEAPWYHGYMPRDEINRLLRVSGNFILRLTELKKGEGFQFVLSVRVGDRVCHFPVCMNDDGQFYIKHNRTFPTVTEMVQHYISSGEEITENTHAKCVTAVPRQPWELQRNQITIGPFLAKGEYGAVHSGTLRQGNSEIPVAVKLHKAHSLDKATIVNFGSEGRLLRDYRHPNVVKFYGISFDKEPILLCMELADGGSLNSFLKKNRNNGKKKLKMCMEAARGLAYLHSKKCIHRDVAARNCLVSDCHIKISDFGLAYTLAQSADKDEKPGADRMPVRWLAPEAMLGNYSLMSDVYSFGVLMWEIYTDGEMPFRDKQMNDVYREVQTKGLRLERPKSMPEAVAKVMVEGCFPRDPQKRLTMDKIRRTLEKLYKETKNTGSTKSARQDHKHPKSKGNKKEPSSKRAKSTRRE